MSKREFDEMASRLYAAYVNIRRKAGRSPIPFRMFKARMRVWKEW